MAGSILTVYRLPTSQKLTVTSTGTTLSSNLGEQTTTFRLATNISMWFTSGSSTVTASSTGASGSHYIHANETEYININAKHKFMSFTAESTAAGGFVSLSEAT